MKNRYVLAFRLGDPISPDELMESISTYFGNRDILHIGNKNDDEFFLTKYPDKMFKMTINSNPNFGDEMRILTDSKTYPQSM